MNGLDKLKRRMKKNEKKNGNKLLKDENEARSQQRHTHTHKKIGKNDLTFCLFICRWTTWACVHNMTIIVPSTSISAFLHTFVFAALGVVLVPLRSYASVFS